MDEPTASAAVIIDHARTAADALQQLCRAAVARPSMTPADVDVALAHLAAAVAALPQAASQLSDILERAKHDYVLAVDNLIEARDPDLVIDTARLHLDNVHQPAVRVSRLLDAAHNETARIRASERIVKPPNWLALDATPLAQAPKEYGLGRNPVVVATPVPHVESFHEVRTRRSSSLRLVGPRRSMFETASHFGLARMAKVRSTGLATGPDRSDYRYRPAWECREGAAHRPD